MIASELSPDQARQAQILADLLQSHAHDALLDVARLLVASPDSQLLGNTQFDVRDRLLRLLADAYRTHLDQKKTNRTNPMPSTALPASSGPASTNTDPDPS